MQFLATAEQMQAFDRAAIRDAGIPALLLMENAGRAFVEALARKAGALQGQHVLVLCGGGNNGGDGFVIARHLANRGCRVHVVLLGRAATIKGDAKINLDIVSRLRGIRGTGLRFTTLASRAGITRLGSPDIIVDAIFGTGFSGAVRGHYRDVIAWVNSHHAFVAAVDIPSGVNATNGAVSGEAIRARLTVTMASAKIGHFVGPGCDCSGEVEVADISIPPALIRPGKDSTFRISAPDVREVLPRRARTAHKYSVGKVLVVGGSRRFTGAPLMTAAAALRSGAGAVILGVPKSVHDVVARRVEELLLTSFEETPQGTLGKASLGAILERSSWADAVALGPGLSRNDETMALVREAALLIDRPLVVDADALWAFTGKHDALRRRKAQTVLTPHAGEFATLMGTTPKLIEADRVGVARSASKEVRSVIVLKGSPTVVARPDGRVIVNSSGNPGMATIGSGDVLTGIIAGLIAQGTDPVDAATAGVFLHGLAGDIGAARLGQRSLLASDIEQSLPEAMMSLDH